MIQLSFAEIYGQVQAFMQDTSAGTLTVIKSEINKEYERVAAAREWPELTTELNESINYVSGQNYLALPGDCTQLLALSDKTNSWSVSNKSLIHLIEDNISRLDIASDVIYYANLGLKATRRPLSVADMVEALSESASDTAISVRVSGLRDTFLVNDAETIALNGTTAVAGTLTYRIGWSIESFSTNGSPVGIVTLREKTADTVLGYIPKGSKESRFFIIRLMSVPAGTDALNVIYKKNVRRLTNDNDAPVLPIGNYLVEQVKGTMRQFDRKYLQAREHGGAAANIMGSILAERRMQGNEQKQARPMRPKPSRGY